MAMMSVMSVMAVMPMMMVLNNDSVDNNELWMIDDFFLKRFQAFIFKFALAIAPSLAPKDRSRKGTTARLVQ